MRFFHQLVAVVVITLVGVLAWDLSQRRITYGDKELIIYAGMFGPGEPVQLLYSGPPPGLAPREPFGPAAAAHYAALIQAWPDYAEQVRSSYQAVYRRPLKLDEPTAETTSAPGGDGSAAATQGAAESDESLAARYRQLDPAYIRQLVEALGEQDETNRLKLFNAFADLHPQYDKRMIQVFQDLHPAYTIGLFEDFERRFPQYEVVERWDGRWVLSANRPRFLTGADVPDLIAGSLLELRILYQENLALPLDQPIPDAETPIWREKGIMYGPSLDDPGAMLKDTFHPWALQASRYTVSQADANQNNHPFPAGTEIQYLWPDIVHSNVIFYNRAHFRQIGRDPDDFPETVAQFEQICEQLRAAGIEPIAQDGMTYMEMWWGDLVNRTLGYDTYVATCGGDLPRFAGPQGDPRYLACAQRLRGWRQRGFWMDGFSASKWPGAQRDFGTGRCTFLFTGTWLPAEISNTRSYDPQVFDPSCFIFPAVVGGEGNPRQISCNAQGHAITRQGENPEGAALLLSYLSAYGAEIASSRLNYISAQKNVAFPESVRALGPILDAAGPGDIITGGLQSLFPRFFKFVLGETFSKFFVHRSDELSPEGFVERLEHKAQMHYKRYGKGT